MHGSYTACRPEPGSPQKPAGPTHHSTPGLWDKPEKAETNRGSLRVDEDGRDAAPTTTSRVRASGLGVHFGGCGSTEAIQQGLLERLADFLFEATHFDGPEQQLFLGAGRLWSGFAG